MQKQMWYLFAKKILKKTINNVFENQRWIDVEVQKTSFLILRYIFLRFYDSLFKMKGYVKYSI